MVVPNRGLLPSFKAPGMLAKLRGEGAMLEEVTGLTLFLPLSKSNGLLRLAMVSREFLSIA